MSPGRRALLGVILLGLSFVIPCVLFSVLPTPLQPRHYTVFVVGSIIAVILPIVGIPLLIIGAGRWARSPGSELLTVKVGAMIALLGGVALAFVSIQEFKSIVDFMEDSIIIYGGVPLPGVCLAWVVPGGALVMIGLGLAGLFSKKH
jgi:hypothetical protein